MNGQFSFPGFEPSDYREMAFLEPLFPDLKASAANCGGASEQVTLKSTDGYTVVMFRNLTAFRLHLRGKQYYISLPIVLADLIPSSFPTKQIESDEKYIRILISKDHPIESYKDFLILAVGETVNRYPKEYDCCSRYMECSDAKTCIHPDKSFALGCGYRKILSSGRIFYGKNRNID